MALRPEDIVDHAKQIKLGPSKIGAAEFGGLEHLDLWHDTHLGPSRVPGSVYVDRQKPLCHLRVCPTAVRSPARQLVHLLPFRGQCKL